MTSAVSKLAALVLVALIAASCSTSPGAAGSGERVQASSSDSDASTSAEDSSDTDPVATAEPTAAPAAEVTPTPETTPTPAPTPPPTPTAAPTPTAVPPTPVWVEVDTGPSVSPFRYVVEASPDEVRIVDGRDAAIDDATVTDAPEGLVGSPVLTGDPSADLVEVVLPSGNAWVVAEDLTFGFLRRVVEVDVATNRLRVFEGNELLVDAPIDTGSRDTPTAALSGHIRAEAEDDDEGTDAEGSSLPSFTILSDDPEIEPTTIRVAAPETSLGGYDTDGSIAVERSVAFLLAAILADGARVEIVGTPAPIPTPVPPRPTVAVVATATPVPVATECPADALGTPPDCYVIVKGQQIYGPCGNDYAITFGDSCWLFAGDVERGLDGRTRCPASAEYRLDNRCYVPAGFREVIEVLCPDGATAVDLECRRPVG